MRDDGAHEVGHASLVIRPNRSLSVAGVVTLFFGLSALTLTVGIGFMLAGAWLVLPFALVEVLIIGVLCGWFYRHLDDCELVVVEPDRIWVTKRRGRQSVRADFPRYWVRVIYGGDQDGPGPARLWIGSHGRFISLADDINEIDRAQVARELESLLRVPA